MQREGANTADAPEDFGIIVEGCTVLQDLRDVANGCTALLHKVLMGLDRNKLSTKVQVFKNKLHE